MNPGAQIAEIMERRANEIASFLDRYRANPDHLGSVELGLTREIERLRALGSIATKMMEDS